MLWLVSLVLDICAALRAVCVFLCSQILSGAIFVILFWKKILKLFRWLVVVREYVSGSHNHGAARRCPESLFEVGVWEKDLESDLESVSVACCN